MEKKAKPPLVAVIREAECIGCTKCIQACPVDAIAGASKVMHTIIATECTGCELCLAPCPVDCIDLLPLAQDLTSDERQKQADLARNRYQARQKRLSEKKSVLRASNPSFVKTASAEEKKAYIQAAILRSQQKKRELTRSGS
jgi:Na+-translocating ferredoxin:NAD+ oxidoreductase subunit B